MNKRKKHINPKRMAVHVFTEQFCSEFEVDIKRV